MKFFLLVITLFSSSLEARRDADSIYDRQLDRAEERRILYYNRWFKQQKHNECEQIEGICPACPAPCFYEDCIQCEEEGL